MTKISIDMSKDDETAQNRIFAEVVEEQTTNTGEVTLLCDFESANYDFDNSKKVEELQEKLEIAIKAFEKLQRRNCVDCKCGENCSLREYSKKGKGCSTCVAGLAQEALVKIKEIK